MVILRGAASLLARSFGNVRREATCRDVPEDSRELRFSSGHNIDTQRDFAVGSACFRANRRLARQRDSPRERGDSFPPEFRRASEELDGFDLAPPRRDQSDEINVALSSPRRELRSDLSRAESRISRLASPRLMKIAHAQGVSLPV